MNEEELLKKFAKALGAEEKLEEIEQKKIQQEKMLKGMAKLLGTESLLEEIEQKKANEQALIDEKREKERKMLESMNAALARLVNNNPEHAEAIQQEVEETIVAVAQEEPITIEAVAIEEEEVVVAENASQPQPELPKDDIITQTVKNISKAAPGEIQQKVDALPPGIRKELDILKKSITDLHRFATNHSQLGGGGEVWFRWLDDVNRSTMESGNDNFVLEYDAATRKVQFTENIGAIRTILFNQTGPTSNLVAGQMGWNTAEDCLDIHQADGSTLQVGLENYIQVHNHQGSTLLNGTLVGFNGVDEDTDHIIGVPYIADANSIPSYVIGVLTNDIPDQGFGRATNFGKVHDLNTTGSDVSETWVLGDVLYASPTTAGKLTKVKPTAPNTATIIAKVVKVHATEGILFVRPIMPPRLHYGSFSYNNGNQTAASANTPYAVAYNTTDIASGHSISNDTRIVAAVSGLYNYQFSLQLVSTNASTKDIWIWARKSGTDIPNSATRVTISGAGTYLVPSWNFIVSMNANQYFELMWAVSDTSVSITSPSATTFCPAIPGVILTVTEAAL